VVPATWAYRRRRVLAAATGAAAVILMCSSPITDATRIFESVGSTDPPPTLAPERPDGPDGLAKLGLTARALAESAKKRLTAGGLWQVVVEHSFGGRELPPSEVYFRTSGGALCVFVVGVASSHSTTLDLFVAMKPDVLRHRAAFTYRAHGHTGEGGVTSAGLLGPIQRISGPAPAGLHVLDFVPGEMDQREADDLIEVLVFESLATGWNAVSPRGTENGPMQ
jgi:hypothetical protein